MTLSIDDFGDFFKALHDFEPYPWQRRLAACTVQGEWPGAIDLPTGSGKTACIDIALFALACQADRPPETRRAPRRIFFCVNRRVIVDEGHQRARRIAEKLNDAALDEGILGRVTSALRSIAGTTREDEAPPLDVLELRGGIYRDNRWARSLAQPTVVCTTVDQLGSRLLFRGYGVSKNAAPIQAALIAYDALLLLDEAHISEPFRQTLVHVGHYLDAARWAERRIGAIPMTVVPMTATPTAEMRSRGVESLADDDRRVERLDRRLRAVKPARLRETKDIAREAVHAALSEAAEGPTAIGIIVNRVATAREIYDQLRATQSGTGTRKLKLADDALVELVIGSMRPVDRDAQAERLRDIVGPRRPSPESTRTSIVVATQCLEVGADYDFDVLVTECASLDALQQRFGRLNRGGRVHSDGVPFAARATVVMAKKAVKTESEILSVEQAKEPTKRALDPIYGNALARTWSWLSDHATHDVVDFGIDAMSRLREGTPLDHLNLMRSPSASINAPTMLPAHVDLWCQTTPRPALDPDVALFLHGPQSVQAEVQVCWRADLCVGDDGHVLDDSCDVVALLPPTAAECMRLPIGRVLAWLKETNEEARHKAFSKRADNDYFDPGEIEAVEGSGVGYGEGGVAVLWRGAADSVLLTRGRPSDLRPGDTVVLPVSACGWDVLGHVPPETREEPEFREQSDDSDVDIHIDRAEEAFLEARDRAAIRLHPAFRRRFPDSDGFDALFSTHDEDQETPSGWRERVEQALSSTSDHDALGRLSRLLEGGFLVEAYPDGSGVVLLGRGRLRDREFARRGLSPVPRLDDGQDDSSRTLCIRSVPLSDHSKHVSDAVDAILSTVSVSEQKRVLRLAAAFHDLGKADERFQAMLTRSSRTDAWLLAGRGTPPLAKSQPPRTRQERRHIQELAGLPVGFRHEMLSMQLCETMSDRLEIDDEEQELLLHLVAAHHGWARPLAPVVLDADPPGVRIEAPGVGLGPVALGADQRRDSDHDEFVMPAHRLDSGVAERFWTLTRRFGWWGLAYLEAILRLADQSASANEERTPLSAVKERV